MATQRTAARNSALLEMAPGGAIRELDKANQADVTAAHEAGPAPALIDRPTLTPTRVAAIVKGCRDVAALPDLSARRWTGGYLRTGCVCTSAGALGVLAAIYESRPNVTIEISTLCVKTGNAVILRGGKETLRSNTLLAELASTAYVQAGLPRFSAVYQRYQP